MCRRPRDRPGSYPTPLAIFGIARMLNPGNTSAVCHSRMRSDYVPTRQSLSSPQAQRTTTKPQLAAGYSGHLRPLRPSSQPGAHRRLSIIATHHSGSMSPPDKQPPARASPRSIVHVPTPCPAHLFREHSSAASVSYLVAGPSQGQCSRHSHGPQESATRLPVTQHSC